MKKIIVFLLSLLFIGCDNISGYGGKLSQPLEASVEIRNDSITKIKRDDIALLQRYFAGNPRWEIRKERGQFYAIRREKIDGTYKTTLNGFYSVHSDAGWVQTRVIVSFGEPYGFGRDRGNITRVKAQDGLKIKTIVEDSHSGSPGYSSYVIVLGNGVNIEVFDQSPELKREFTESSLAFTFKEIQSVLEYKSTIQESGKVPIPEYYPEKKNQEQLFQVKNGMQRGIFLVEAWVNPLEAGELYLKAFNTSTGARLSAQRMTPRSIRLAAWSIEPNVFFPYNAEVTVYEGDWDHEYEARFELWHKNSEGKDIKLLETSRIINGWER